MSNFNKAVQTAIEYLESVKDIKDICYNDQLVCFSDIKTAREQPPKSTRYKDGLCFGVVLDEYYHIKLFDNYKVNNEALIKIANIDHVVFSGLLQQLAYEIENGFNIAPEFAKFIADYLRGDIKKPPKPTRKENFRRKANLAWACYLVIHKHGLRHTRNDATDDKTSALDAVAKAANTTYSHLKKDIYPLRYIWDWRLNPVGED